MKILVTGANGQLGRALQKQVEKGIFLDKDELDLLGSAAEIETKIKTLAPEVIIHCAAHTAVDAAEIEANIAYRINSLSTAAIVNASRRLHARLIYISTDYVLHDMGADPLFEEAAVSPQSVYARSKYLGEQLVGAYENGCTVRTSWVFGEGKNFIKTMYELGKTKDTVSVVADQIGRPTFAEDLAAALSTLADEADLPKIIHIQNSGPAVSWADLARFIFEASGADTKVTPINTADYIKQFGSPDKPVAPRPTNSVFNMARAQGLGIIMPDWQASVRAYLKTLQS